MTQRLSFELQAVAPNSAARVGVLRSPRGAVQTPVFMPVGTQATVRGMDTQTLKDLKVPVLLANTYHLLLRPGADVFKRFGGIHKFMNWQGWVLTDSGGFQIFSLPNSRRITEDGATFKSYIDGSLHLLSPESSIGMQKAIGSDIMMVLDECVPSTSSFEESRRAMDLTHRWALRSHAARGESQQALFGIVQGACHEKLRVESASFLSAHDFDGFAIGGLAVGETLEERQHFTAFTAQLLPPTKPRYLMGVGTPADLLDAVHRGVDMFDCILPSSMAQQGTAFTKNGWQRLRRTPYRLDQNPICSDCACNTCRNYTRGYIHHLVRAHEGFGWRLIAHHNFYFYHQLMLTMREQILNKTFYKFYVSERPKLALIDAEYPAVANPLMAKVPGRGTLAQSILGDYEVVLSTKEQETFGTIRQISSGEVMHPCQRPDDESYQLYVAQSGLIALLEAEDPSPLIVWDIGLGAAHNAMAVIRSAESLATEKRLKRNLKIISFETDLDSLKLALQHKRYFMHLRHRAPGYIAESGLFKSPEGIQWELLEGPFLQNIAETQPPHIVLFDPFSTKSDESSWSFAAFQKLAQAMDKTPAILVTYSTSTSVRACMLAAGFRVFAGIGLGARQESTVAVSGNHTTLPLHPATTLLNKSWLERWHKSSARYPQNTDPETQAFMEAKIKEHPQFLF